MLLNIYTKRTPGRISLALHSPGLDERAPGLKYMKSVRRQETTGGFLAQHFISGEHRWGPENEKPGKAIRANDENREIANICGNRKTHLGNRANTHVWQTE